MEGLAAPPPEHALLAGITALAAEGEALAAQTASRFDASVPITRWCGTARPYGADAAGVGNDPSSPSEKAPSGNAINYVWLFAVRLLCCTNGSEISP